MGQPGGCRLSSFETARVGVGGVEDLVELADLVAVERAESVDGFGSAAQVAGVALEGPPTLAR